MSGFSDITDGDYVVVYRNGVPQPVPLHELARADISARSLVVLAGASMTLRRRDANSLIKTTSASAVTILVPPQSVVPFPLLTFFYIKQHGVGQVTVAALTGAVSIVKRSVFTAKTAGQYAAIGLVQDEIDMWTLTGDLEAA